MMERDLNPAELPVPFTLARLEDHLRELPMALFDCPPGIYFLILKNRVVYVGKTTFLLGRLLQHYRTKKFSRVLFLPVADPERRARLETELIRTLRPTLNSSDRLSDDVPAYHESLDALLMAEFASKAHELRQVNLIIPALSTPEED